jgi:hypothetical protein
MAAGSGDTRLSGTVGALRRARIAGAPRASAHLVVSHKVRSQQAACSLSARVHCC